MIKAFLGELQVPLPDPPLARADMFGRISEAWSVMLTRVDEIVAANDELEAAMVAAAKLGDTPHPKDKPKRRKHRRKGR